MKKILYFGLEIPQALKQKQDKALIVHCPLITIEKRPLGDPDIVSAFSRFEDFTHIILTSKVAVSQFFLALKHFHKDAEDKVIVAVGQATAQAIAKEGLEAAYIASEESSEGIIKMLGPLELINAYFLWPCSALSRRVIPDFFKQKGIRFCQVPLYTTLANESCKELLQKQLAEADELVFTSPSTVDAFIRFCGRIPLDKQITPIGPVTAKALNELTNDNIQGDNHV